MAWLSTIPGALLRALAETREKIWRIVQREVCADYNVNQHDSHISKKAWYKTGDKPIVTKEAWLEMNKTVTHLKQVLSNADNQSHDVMQEVWPDVNKLTVSFNRLYQNADQAFEHAQPTFESISPLLVVCLALPIILYIAYQAKQLLPSRRQADYETVRSRYQTMESTTLRAVYWLCITIALIFMFILVAVSFNHIVDLSEIIWVAQTPQLLNILSSLDHYNVLKVFILFHLYLLVLAFVLRLHKEQLQKWAKNLLWFSVYTLAVLPTKLVLNPPHRAWRYCRSTSSCCKGSVSVAFYGSFYTTLAVAYGYYIWHTALTTELNVQLIIPVLVLLYLATIVAYVIGTVFNWMIMNIEGFLFTVHQEDDSTDEVDFPEISTRQNRIYYTIQYYQ